MTLEVTIRYRNDDQSAWTVLDDSPPPDGCVDYQWTVRTWDDITDVPWLRSDMKTWEKSCWGSSGTRSQFHPLFNDPRIRDTSHYSMRIDPLDISELLELPRPEWNFWEIRYYFTGSGRGDVIVHQFADYNTLLCRAVAHDDLAGRWIVACALAAAATTKPPERTP